MRRGRGLAVSPARLRAVALVSCLLSSGAASPVAASTVAASPVAAAPLAASPLAPSPRAAPPAATRPAHDGLPARLVRAEERATEAPGDVAAWIDLAELRLDLDDWAGTLTALDHAETLQAGRADAALLRARLHVALGWHDTAEDQLDTLLGRAPDLAAAWLLRADLFEELGRSWEAADDLARALAHGGPSAELSLRRARLLAEPDAEAALAALDEALAAAGPSPALVREALVLEQRLGRHDAALARHAAARPAPVASAAGPAAGPAAEPAAGPAPVGPPAARLESWWVTQGDLLLAAGRPREGADAYRACLAAWERLPARRRQSAALLTLRQRARDGLAACAAPPPAQASHPPCVAPTPGDSP